MSEENVIVEFDHQNFDDLLGEGIKITDEARQALKELIEKEVKNVVDMLLETTAIQGKYTAQDIRQILSLKGFNICY
jgi:hypothetical protein